MPPPSRLGAPTTKPTQTDPSRPIIDLTLPRDALPRTALEALARELSEALLQCEVARDNTRAAAMNWVYVHPHDDANLLIAGQVLAKPHYRIDVTLMAGAMSELQREAIATDMTAAVIRAEGGDFNPLNAARVWVLFHEVPDGCWAAGGRLYRLADVMRLVASPRVN
jgi:phenylpyruvate tautomerase PptA (4-oxalocrotonate tautomerase family)